MVAKGIVRRTLVRKTVGPGEVWLKHNCLGERKCRVSDLRWWLFLNLVLHLVHKVQSYLPLKYISPNFMWSCHFSHCIFVSLPEAFCSCCGGGGGRAENEMASSVN
ncbi:UNVERIFIED_CONTAM: hypothetical protein K2H54_045842 [Gekko kuhli]